MTPVERQGDAVSEAVRIAEALKRIAVALQQIASQGYPPQQPVTALDGHICPQCGAWTQLGTHVCYTAPHTVYGGDPW